MNLICSKCKKNEFEIEKVGGEYLETLKDNAPFMTFLRCTGCKEVYKIYGDADCRFVPTVDGFSRPYIPKF